MPRKSVVKPIAIRRIFSQEFKQDAVQMVLDGHTARSIVERVADVYAIADAVSQEYIASTQEVCAVLDISRSAFYSWKCTPSFVHSPTHLSPLTHDYLITHSFPLS